MIGENSRSSTSDGSNAQLDRYLDIFLQLIDCTWVIKYQERNEQYTEDECPTTKVR